MSLYDGVPAKTPDLPAGEWIERYVAQVLRWTPQEQRATANVETRRAIAAQLGSRSADDPAAVLEALRALGAPNRYAMRFGATQWLVGPLLYPIFLVTLQIVLGITLAAGLFVLFLGVGLTGAPVETFAEGFGGLLGGLLQAGATVVLVFAIIERAGHLTQRDDPSRWNPAELKPIEVEDRAKVGDLVVTIVFGTLAILLLSGFANGWAHNLLRFGDMQRLVLFNDGFATFIPWLSAWFAADILLAILVLAWGRWRPVTRMLKMAVNLVGLGVLFQMLVAGPLTTFPPAEIGVRVAVAIVMALIVVDTVRQALALVRRAGSSLHLPLSPAGR